MELFIRNHIKSLGLDYTTDQYGNIYCTKGVATSYPCIVSHIDTVHNLQSEFKVTSIPKKDDVDTIWVAFNKNRQVGVGGDDKCGIYVCLHLLEILPEIKVVFFKDEEVGGIGSDECNYEYFDDVRFIIENDRRGNNEFIVKTGGIELTSQEFRNDVNSIMLKHNYQFSDGGTFTDLNNLKKVVHVCMLNIACGYYNAHTETEYISQKDLENCLNVNYALCTTLDKIYQHKSYIKTYKSYKQYSTVDYKWDDNIDISEDLCPKCDGIMYQVGNFRECSVCFHFEDVGKPNKVICAYCKEDNTGYITDDKGCACYTYQFNKYK